MYFSKFPIFFFAWLDCTCSIANQPYELRQRFTSKPGERAIDALCTETGKRKVSKAAGQTLDSYCVCRELLSASIADVLWFVNIVCLPLIAEQKAHEICLTQECLQIIRRLIWKQTTDSLRNSNAMFHGNLRPSSFEQPTQLSIMNAPNCAKAVCLH